jgi:mannitol/fructose-specific phosphotransferase system IIA component (Ntr-type)/Na+/melibiose symporter-like transporter
MADSAGSSRAALCLACAARNFALAYGTLFFFIYLHSVLEAGTRLPVSLGIMGALAAGAGEIIAGFIRDHASSRRTLMSSCFTIGAAASLSLMFLLPLKLESTAYCTPAFLCFAVCHCAGTGGFMGGIAEFSSKIHLRESMLSLPQGIGFALSLTLCTVYACLIYFADDQEEVGYIFVSGAAVASLFMLIFREPPEAAMHGVHQHVDSLRQAFRIVSSNDQLLVAAAISFMRQFSVVLMFLALSLYVLYFNSGVWMLTLFVLPPAVARSLSGLMFSRACEIFTRKSVFMLGTVLAACGFCASMLLDIASDTLTAGVSLALALACFGAGWMLSSSWMMAADCTDYGEFRLALRSPSLCFSVVGACRCAGCAAAIAVSAIAASLSSRYYRPIGSEIALYAFRAQTLLAVLAAAGCAIAYASYYKLNGSVIENIISGLERTHLGLPRTVKALRHPLRYALCREAAICRLDADSVEEALEVLSGRLGLVRSVADTAAFRRAVARKMSLAPAGIAEGIAVPHASGSFVKRPAMAVATLAKPLDFGAPDGRKCDLIFMLAAPDDGQSYITMLGQLSLMLGTDGFADRLRRSVTGDEITDRILECERHMKF